MAYTTITKSTDYHSSTLYTGNGSASSREITTNSPVDMLWLKNRGGNDSHIVEDNVRGAGKSHFPDITDAEATLNRVTAMGATSFTIATDNSSMNSNSVNYASWNWKAGTTSGIATDGETDITPAAYSFNATSGVSIVKYTGTGTSGEGVPHGLGAKPQFIIVKRTDSASAWTVYWQPILNTSNATKFFEMHNSDAEATNNNRWNGWQADTVNFYIGDASETNASGGTYIAYVFAAKPGFSKVGKYRGNGDASNPVFINCGFKPKFVIIKVTSETDDWFMHDDKRDGYNDDNEYLFPSLNNAEGSNVNRIRLLSNGFSCPTSDKSHNKSGATYYYVAFGQTIVGTNNVPATAR